MVSLVLKAETSVVTVKGCTLNIYRGLDQLIHYIIITSSSVQALCFCNRAAMLKFESSVNISSLIFCNETWRDDVIVPFLLLYFQHLILHTIKQSCACRPVVVQLGFLPGFAQLKNLNMHMLRFFITQTILNNCTDFSLQLIRSFSLGISVVIALLPNAARQRLSSCSFRSWGRQNKVQVKLVGCTFIIFFPIFPSTCFFSLIWTNLK